MARVPADEFRCTSDDARKGGRCPQPRLPGDTFCRKHYLAQLSPSSTVPSPPPRTAKKRTAARSPPTSAIPLKKRGKPKASFSPAATVANEARSVKRRKYCKNHHQAKLCKHSSSDSWVAASEPVKVDFEVGEIWVVTHDSNGQPGAYARIDRIIPADGQVEVAPLFHHPVSDEEMGWAEEGLTVACGVFRACNSTIQMDISSLSHRVVCEDEGKGSSRSYYKIFPKTGEVWAVFDDVGKSSKYHLVEIVSGYTEEAGATAARLQADESSGGGFRRHQHEGYELLRTFMRKDLMWFSHRVPALRMAADGGRDGGNGGMWLVMEK